MSRTLTSLLLLVSASALGATLPERVRAIASQLGAEIPAAAAEAPAAPAFSAPASAAPAPQVRTAPIKVVARLTGSARADCAGGRASGSARLAGTARVAVAGGFDDVPVSVSIDLGGACEGGKASGAGRLTVSDAVYLYKDGRGRAVGYVSLEGGVSVAGVPAGSEVAVARDVELTGVLETPCVGHWRCAVVPDPGSR